MQDASIGSWARESHLSVEYLDSLRGLNHRFLDLAGAWADDWTVSGALSAALAGQVTPLSAAQRRAAANCPYALFDLRFQDDGHWQARFQDADRWRVAEESAVNAERVGFVRLALFYAWHVASSEGLAAQLLLGMSAGTAAAFRHLAFDSLPALAAAEAGNLSARWNDCPVYWAALTAAASRTDHAALRRVQLYGLQLAAAARLP